MEIRKINADKILIIFLLGHLLFWTIIPSISNDNLPLDTIEALAWGSNFDWGYSKHPPLSAFVVRLFYLIFENQDWAYYFLSQIFVIIAFFVVWKFSEEFFKNKSVCLVSVLLLEGIYFYNFTTPEFNVNVCQLPFWALTVYYSWKSYKQKHISNWILFGVFAALGFLSKYLFIYLLIGIKIFFSYIIIKEKKYNYRYLLPGSIFILILIPHLIWLTENNYTTLVYAFNRAGIEELNYLNHLYYPFTFLGKQIGILIPFFIMFLFIITKFKPKFNLKDKKLLFLLIINLVPLILIFLTSLLMGVKIRTMWMTPFYLFSGVLLIYIFEKQVNLKKLKYFFSVFLILFIFSPITYLYISIKQTDKRTDYPGKEIAKEIQKRWDENFINNINSVIGDEWHAGNLSYHLQSNPRWYSYSAAFVDKSFEDFMEIIGKNGFIIVNGECSYGISFTVKNNKICMSGNK